MARPAQHIASPDRHDHPTIDWVGIVAILLLATLGVLFIYSAHSAHDGTFWKKQLFFCAVGGVAYIAVSLVHYRFFLENAHTFFYLGILLLILVLIPGIGVERFGAQRWINLGPIAFQPAETAKIAVLLMAASILARTKLGIMRDSWSTVAYVTGITFVPLALIMKQPDLGSALVIPPTILALLFIGKLSVRFFVAIFASATLLLVVLSLDLFRYYDYMSEHGLSFNEDKGAYERHSLLPLRDYQRNRILTNVIPRAIDPHGTGATYNLIQSKLAVASGRWSGKGITESTLTGLGYVPLSVTHNDFIFAVIAEETGYLGSLILVGLFALLLFNNLRVASLARDRFGQFLALGVSVIFMVHIFVNIGMTIGLMPITGLPLPFVSYGGSFFVSCCILQGLVQSVYRYRRERST